MEKSCHWDDNDMNEISCVLMLQRWQVALVLVTNCIMLSYLNVFVNLILALSVIILSHTC